MAVTAVVEHRSEYRFDPPVRVGPQDLRLRPADHAPGVRSWHLDVEPHGARATWRHRQGWWRGRLAVPGRVGRLALAATTTVDHRPLDPTGLGRDGAAPPAGAGEGPPPAAVQALVDGLARPGEVDDPGEAVTALVAVAERVAAAVVHEERHDDLDRSVAEVLDLGRGSCRDSAAVLAAAARAVGAPARVVTGLLVRLAGCPDLVAPWAQGAHPTRDGVDLHAWVEAWLPTVGWVGVDPTSGRPAGAGHLPLGADAHRAPVPVSGTTEPCRAELATDHRVRRLDDPGGSGA